MSEDAAREPEPTEPGEDSSATSISPKHDAVADDQLVVTNARVGPEESSARRIDGDDGETEDEAANGSNEEHGLDEDEITSEQVATPASSRRRRRKRRRPKRDAAELVLQGRRALCKRIADIAPNMLKTVKLRILGRHLNSTKGMNEQDLENCIVKDAKKLAEKSRVLENLYRIDPDVNRRTLKAIIIYGVLLQEETHSLEESRLEEKVIAYEKQIVKDGKNGSLFDPKQHDQMRWHHYDTYRIVLEAAWRNDDDISSDEASLLLALREHLNISLEEHWQIGAFVKRFPKVKCEVHTADEIHDARKELQRDGILWSYRDENNRNIDVLPFEIVNVIRQHDVQLELQRTNYRRLLQHDSIRLGDLRGILQSRDMDRYGPKAELIERIVNSDVKPSQVLNDLDRAKLSEMCAQVALKSSGNKADLVQRLIDFYDDLSFEERVTQDAREEWYNNYELLAARSYADLRAKKLINKDLDVEHQFEKATDFLFETRLHITVDKSRKVCKADGRIPLDNRQVILWDCKSVEGQINLHDYIDDQFDSYLRKEREKGYEPIAFLVIGPTFTKQSLKAAYQFKARTNWDVALIQADALKLLADHWSAMETQKPFPVGLFNRTEVIDRERAEFLLSLA